MEFGQILDLIKAVSASNLTEFEMEDGKTKISMGAKKEAAAVRVAEPVPQEEPEETKPASGTGRLIKAPLVGTFYQSPSPEGAPFVEVGDQVKKGQVLGIVEAMKLMNEIESEFDGRVKEILVKNEQMVEFGQPMFVIE